MEEENNELITVLNVISQWLIDPCAIKNIGAEFKSESKDTHDEWRALQPENLGDED